MFWLKKTPKTPYVESFLVCCKNWNADKHAVSVRQAWICVGDIFRENEDAGAPDFYFLEL